MLDAFGGVYGRLINEDVPKKPEVLKSKLCVFFKRFLSIKAVIQRGRTETQSCEKILFHILYTFELINGIYV